MKKILMLVCSVLIICYSSRSQSATYFEKNGSLSSDVLNADVGFPRGTMDILIPEAGTYLILISAQGSTTAMGGDPFKCYQRDGIVKVWSFTRNIELARTPINYILADQNSQGIGNPAGLQQLTFPYYNLAIMTLNKNEAIGLKGFVSKTCSNNAVLGSWHIFDARLKIVKIN